MNAHILETKIHLYLFLNNNILYVRTYVETERDLENGDKISKMRDVIFGYEDDETKKPSKKSRNPSKGTIYLIQYCDTQTGDVLLMGGHIYVCTYLYVHI